MSKIREAKIELYRRKGKIHPRAVSGRFNNWRWGMVWFTQLVFYGACWLNWDGRQALLFDIAHERFYLFGWVLWPQDALLLALLLIGAATALFFVTALAGRLFCGFACPQTVYTEIFTWIEARIEGDHLARLRLDAAPFGPRKLALRVAKHGAWGLLALWTGITFVGYFSPIDELLARLTAFRPGPWEGFWVAFYALFTYVQAGLAREAVCQHMCPYSRFQGVMFDTATKSVAYDAGRGEPRAARRATDAARGERGDCVDCGLCVEVCPTGIDIRDGLQYQCINCGLCADACDEVMTRVGAPTGLIRFAAEGELAGKPLPSPLRRPRVAVYAASLLLVVAAGGWFSSARSPLLVDVLRDRGALLRESEAGIENAYTLRLMNRSPVEEVVEVSVDGLPGLQVLGPAIHALPPDSVSSQAVTLVAPAAAGAGGLQPIRIAVRSLRDPRILRVERSSFALPR
jgi:cytochrome c oxidase accessory protein FixG